MALEIDINCDMGESFGRYRIGNDDKLLPLISSCNVACGFHGGDPLHIIKTIRAALKYGLQVGAHPSYPDLQGFGRRQMKIASKELRAIISYQLAAVKGLTESLGGKLTYVKPHGALYNSMADNEEEAMAVIKAVQQIDRELALMGLAGSPLEELAATMGIHFIREAFADRRYTQEGKLMSRDLEGSVINYPEEAARQVLLLVKNQQVITHTGESIPIKADSICIHGDNPQAEGILQAIHHMAKENNIKIRPFHL